MKNNSYSATIDVNQSAEQAFNSICDVTKWWSRDFEGSSKKLNDEFIIDHPGQHYSKQKVVEFIPFEKIVWLVTDSKLSWLKTDPGEWTNTNMVFHVFSKNNKTKIHFTHEGLIPEMECYILCEQGWNIVVKGWLREFIETGKPSSEMDHAAEIRNKHFHSTN